MTTSFIYSNNAFRRIGWSVKSSRPISKRSYSLDMMSKQQKYHQQSQMAYRRAAGPQSLYRRQRPRPCSAQAGIEETTAPQTQQTFRRQSESTFGILFSQVRHSHSPKLHRSSCLRHLMTLRIRDWLMWSQCLFRGSLSSVQSFWIESQTKLQQITSAILLMRCG